MSRPRLGLFSLRAVIFQGGLHQCPSEKGAKASRLLASTSRSLVTSRLTLPANAGLLRLLPPKTPVRETRRRREPDSNHRSLPVEEVVSPAALRMRARGDKSGLAVSSILTARSGRSSRPTPLRCQRSFAF